MRRILIGLGLFGLGSGVLLAQSLPTQVLQLLARTNTWTGTQTFMDLRVDDVGTPAVTTERIYNNAGSLYWEGTLIAGAGGGTAPHNLLSSTHPDTLAVSPPTRGDLLVANSTPLWARFAVGAVGTFLKSDGTDPGWSTDGGSLTGLNATQLTSGTVPLARLPTTIANAQIDAAAAIAWTKIDKTGSSLADLTTRSAADLSSGTLSDARLSANVSLFGASVDSADILNGAVTAAKLADFGCANDEVIGWVAGVWDCLAVGSGDGTVTSVGLSAPLIFTVSGTPVTAAGTLTMTLAAQSANTVWAGPSTGTSASPAFRSLVLADLPVVADDEIYVSDGTVMVATAVPAATGNSVLQYDAGTNAFAALASVATASNTLTLTNKTLNVESTGNLLTVTEKWYWNAAYCQNATPVTDWSTPTTNPAVAACITGANTQKGVLDFADGANTLSVQTEKRLPADWTGTVDVALTWHTTATAGSVVWQVATICVASGETGDPAFNTASTVTQAAQGVASRYSVATISTLTVTGCAASEQLYLRVFRDPTNGSDTLAATARLVGVELTARRAM